MKFVMKMPFSVHPGCRLQIGNVLWYTATVQDKDGRTVGPYAENEGRSAVSQEDANEQAIKKARAWSKQIREFAGL